MGYTLLDGTICLGRCLCEALGVGKNEQGCGYLDEDVKHTHCCFALGPVWFPYHTYRTRFPRKESHMH